MQSHSTTLRAGTVAFVLLAPIAANAALITPTGLAPGQGYRLGFVTSGAIDGLSSDIATYNNFVKAQAQVNSDLAGLGWTAIVSTATVDAVDNVNCAGCNDVPIYLIDGRQLAASTVAMFATGLLSKFNETQLGNTTDSYVWTGSTSTGIGKTASSSNRTMGANSPAIGVTFNQSYWIAAGSDSRNNLNRVYALSDEIFATGAAAAVPEPTTLALLGTAGLLAAGSRRRARRTQA